MPAGVAYDGSVWVTAGSSVALVIGTVGLVAIGGNLAAKRAREGSLSLPTMEKSTNTVGARRETESLRSQPLQKKITEIPEGPKDVDRITE